MQQANELIMTLSPLAFFSDILWHPPAYACESIADFRDHRQEMYGSGKMLPQKYENRFLAGFPSAYVAMSDSQSPGIHLPNTGIHYGLISDSGSTDADAALGYKEKYLLVRWNRTFNHSSREVLRQGQTLYNPVFLVYPAGADFFELIHFSGTRHQPHDHQEEYLEEIVRGMADALRGQQPLPGRTYPSQVCEQISRP